MRILFICNCLEPGRDGVGDYTRRLAAQLILMGHNAAAIALNDDFVTQVPEQNGEAEAANFNIFRLPAALPLKQRMSAAKIFIRDFNPDWLSLQFVIFGYHPKGLPFGIGRQLKALAPGKKWSIMFHELWVAMEEEAKFEHHFWGKIQRMIISSLLKSLKPVAIYTHTSLYIHELKKLGYHAAMLPLFGNIPLVKKSKQNAESKQLDYGESIRFVLFGNIHINAPVQAFAAETSAFAKENNIKITLTMVGRNGSEKQRWIKEWEAAGLKAEVLGEQSPQNVSEIFSRATLGISSTPLAVIEKSGSVAAMHEHSLPVLNVSASWKPRNFYAGKIPGGVMVFQKGNLNKILSEELQLPPVNGVDVIAGKFVNLLKNSA